MVEISGTKKFVVAIMLWGGLGFLFPTIAAGFEVAPGCADHTTACPETSHVFSEFMQNSGEFGPWWLLFGVSILLLALAVSATENWEEW